MISLREPKIDDLPQSVKVYEDSIVRFSKRLNFDIGCHMDFSNYPVDHQECYVQFESFGYETSELSMEWSDKPVFNPEIDLPQYHHHTHLVPH